MCEFMLVCMLVNLVSVYACTSELVSLPSGEKEGISAVYVNVLHEKAAVLFIPPNNIQ